MPQYSANVRDLRLCSARAVRPLAGRGPTLCHTRRGGKSSSHWPVGYAVAATSFGSRHGR